MGIVINKPLNIRLTDIFEHMDIPADNADIYNKSIFHGGSVRTDCSFILHHANRKWDPSIVISGGICVTTSKDILEAIGDSRYESLIALGYVGWGSGQLEQKLMDNTWLNGPADHDIIFKTPFDQCWQRAAGNMGIDISSLSSAIGYA